MRLMVNGLRLNKRAGDNATVFLFGEIRLLSENFTNFAIGSIGRE
jgi:hypothetical protein